MSYIERLPRLVLNCPEGIIYCRRDTTKPEEKVSFEKSPEHREVIEIRGLSSKSTLYYSAMGNEHIFTANLRDDEGLIFPYDGDVVLEPYRRKDSLSDIKMHHVSAPSELIGAHLHRIKGSKCMIKGLEEAASNTYIRLGSCIKPLVFF